MDAPSPQSPSRSAAADRGWLVLVIGAAFAIRVVGVLTDHRMLWPDETYQTVEPAHRLVFGYGFRTWEFVEGTRSWLGPAILTPALWVADRLGVSTGEGLIAASRMWVAALATTSVASAWFLGRRLASRTTTDPATTNAPPAAWVAAVLVAFSPVLVTYDVHPFLDTLAAPMVVAAFALALSPDPAPTRPALGGLLAALAVALRPQTVVLLLALLVVTWIGTDRRTATLCGLGALAGTLVWGTLDWVTWGAPFASAARSIGFNVLEGGADHWGSSPWWFYVATLARAQGWVVGTAVAVGLLGVVGVFRSVVVSARPPSRPSDRAHQRTTLALLLAVLAYLAVLSGVDHKELRFLVPTLPLTLTLAAVGLTHAVQEAVVRPVLTRPLRRKLLAVTLGASLLVTAAVQVHRVDAVTLGASSDDRLAGRNAALVTAALSAAGRLPGTHGVALVGYSLTWSGGLTALHRDVPLVELEAAGPGGVTTPPTSIDTVIAPLSVSLPDGWSVSWTSGDLMVAQSGRVTATPTAPAPAPAPAPAMGPPGGLAAQRSTGHQTIAPPAGRD